MKHWPQTAADHPEFSFSEPVVTPMGDGKFVLSPGKPTLGVKEVGSNAAARILGYAARSSVHIYVMNHPKAHLLRWRYTPGGGKLLFEVPSLLAFKEATREEGKSCSA